MQQGKVHKLDTPKKSHQHRQKETGRQTTTCAESDRKRMLESVVCTQIPKGHWTVGMHKWDPRRLIRRYVRHQTRAGAGRSVNDVAFRPRGTFDVRFHWKGARRVRERTSQTTNAGRRATSESQLPTARDTRRQTSQKLNGRLQSVKDRTWHEHHCTRNSA